MIAASWRVRPWKIAAAVTALRAAFPRAEVERLRPIDQAEVFRITRPQSDVGWGRARSSALRVPPALLSACRDEADVRALIATLVPRIVRGGRTQ